MQPRIASAWNDFAPNAGGQVNVEEVAGVFTATWFQVPEFGVPGTSNSFCCTLDLATGLINVFHDQMSIAGANNGIVGISPGGNLSLANNVDLNVGPNLALMPNDAIYEDFTAAVFGPFDLAVSTHIYIPAGGIGTGPYAQQ